MRQDEGTMSGETPNDCTFTDLQNDFEIFEKCMHVRENQPIQPLDK